MVFKARSVPGGSLILPKRDPNPHPNGTKHAARATHGGVYKGRVILSQPFCFVHRHDGLEDVPSRDLQ